MKIKRGKTTLKFCRCIFLNKKIQTAIQLTNKIPAYLTKGSIDEKINTGIRKRDFCLIKNCMKKKTRINKTPINKGSEIKPEKESIISGEIAIRHAVKKLKK